MSDFAPTDPASYRFWTAEHVRFGDLDMLGHVNNKAFAAYYETARIDYMMARAIKIEKVSLALVRLEIDYLREIRHPATLRLGLSPLRIGNSSLTLACAIFNGDVCCSTSIAIMVCFDIEARASKTFPDSIRKILEADL